MHSNATLVCSNNCCLSLDSSGNIWSFGSTNFGQIGHSSEEKKILPFKQISSLLNINMISLGTNHSICLNYEGEVYSFGKNNYGQLGIGKTNKELAFTHIPQKIDQLPFVKYISCGENFTMCISDDDILYSFGYNSKGQLGINTTSMLISPQKVHDINNVEFIECGSTHVICKTYDNEYYSWGNNTSGQLGKRNNTDFYIPTQNSSWPKDIISIKCGLYHTILLTSEGKVYSCGSNTNGQLANNDKNIKRIAVPTLIKDIPEIYRIECGNFFNLFIDINNNLLVSGSTHYSQLGIPNAPDIYKPRLHEFFKDVIDISAGSRSSFVKTSDNKIFVFGYNENSQLGIEKPQQQEEPIQIKNLEDIWCTNLRRSRQKSARK